MHRWQEELKKHPLNTTLRQLIDVLDVELNIEDPIIESERARFAKILILMKSALDNIDPDIAPIDLVDQINSQISNHGALQTANNFVRSPDQAAFRELNNQLNPLLSYIFQLNSISKDTGYREADLAAATTSFERFSRTVEARRVDLETTNSMAIELIDKSSTAIRENTQKVIDLKSNFESIISEWSDQLHSTSKEQELAFISHISTNNRKFEESISNIAADSTKRSLELFEELRKNTTEKRAEVEENLASILSDAAQRHLKIMELYGLVAQDSVTGGYKNIADREYKSAQSWRVITLATIALSVMWIGYGIFWMKPILIPTQVFWIQTAKSVSLTIVLLSFSVYASKQSSLHRVNERKARAFFLQVQAFDPFIVSLPEEKRHELKQALSARIFGPDDSDHYKAMIENGDFKNIEQAFGVLDQIRKLLHKVNTRRHSLPLR